MLTTAGNAQSPSEMARIQKLFEEQRWQEIVATADPAASPELAFYYGTAQARLEHWNEAAMAFQTGRRLAPDDSRFPTELAGVAFKQQKYAEAEDWLRRALRLNPGDAYVNEFLATVFYLEGNLDAALKYWNRVGKPRVRQFSADPVPTLDPVLFDHTLTIAPASTLRLPDLQSTRARLDQLNLFRMPHFELSARDSGDFDLIFHNIERNGCGGKWGCLLTIFGSTPAETLRFDYYNLGRRALNFNSSFRWDGEKRRISAYLEAPFVRQPRWHWRAGADLRNENWAMLNSFTGPTPLLAALSLKRQAATFEFSDVMSGRWQWSANTEFSHRDFHNILAGTVLSDDLLASGPQLKQTLGSELTLLRYPERRLTINSFGSLSLARLWANGSRTFSQLQGGANTLWFPQHTGDKYEIQHAMRAGKSFGSLPFDELFTLGVLGDTSLLMRAHIATRSGKKGSAPIGENYFVSNFDATRSFSPLSLVKIRVGPFLDTGWTNNLLEPSKWLWDTGIQARVQALGFELAFSYGRDLRSGNNAFVARVP